jgi:NADP-dependent 3-hydroxy acid dehydrogenase YdfG
LQEVEQECKNLNVNALAIPVDICNSDEVEAAVKRCEDELGGINILVNNGKR